MARDLVPIKVTIGLRANGDHDHPDFSVLPSVVASGLDWSRYVDVHGSGWLYDGCCGHKTDTLESPFGSWFGVLLVPKAFADEAVAEFGSTIVKIRETELEPFYNDHVAKDMPEQEIDSDILNAIKVHRDLGRVDEAWMTDALDSTTDSRGIRVNQKKTFASYKTLTNLNVVQ